MPQQDPIPMLAGPSQKAQPFPMAPQYKSNAMLYNESMRSNKMAPQIHNMHTINQSTLNTSIEF